jgi:hypothetical protein
MPNPTPQAFRGLHYDMARGNYETYATLRRIVRLCAELGLNELILYMEDLWRYRKHPDLSNPHSYDPAQMGALAEYAAERGVDFVPSLTTLGHSIHILEKPAYRRLAFPGQPWEFDVLQPAVYDLFRDLFDEVLPHFSSPWVFVNGDEMHLHHLTEEARKLARKKGLGHLYGMAMGRICNLVLERGKRPIVWHDILLHHADALDYLPKETVIAYWFYDHQPTYPAIPYFCSRGYDVLACPGVMKTALNGPAYGRALASILGQAKAAALSAAGPDASWRGKAGKPGVCLGTMTTVWEQCTWKMALLGIYATARWTHDAGLPLQRVLGDFSRDVLGERAPNVGKGWFAASNEDYRMRIVTEAEAGPRSAAERALLAQDRAVRTKRLAKDAAVLEAAQATKNADLERYLQGYARDLRKVRRVTRYTVSEATLLTPTLVDATDRNCRLVKTETQFGHQLLVLTNGLLAVAALPEFGAALLEWAVLGEEPWAPVTSSYEGWAAAEPRIPGDPALGSPWGAGNLGGWRECIYYNARLQPSSIWGRPFRTKVLSKGPDQVAVEFTGRNEVAELRRVVTLKQGKRALEIGSTATNRFLPGYLAIQPNAGHTLPESCVPVLRLIEGKDGAPRSLLDHDGTLHFEPQANYVRVESPINGHFLALSWRRGDVDRMLTDMSAEYFTLEPLGTEKWCKKGESVRLRLRYEVG